MHQPSPSPVLRRDPSVAVTGGCLIPDRSLFIGALP
ncbi:hypothetical protein SOVF_162530 [Spinacia oleracea]|nr:hypothetical protein SOVF_162530 [Spinacia oleracea]